VGSNVKCWRGEKGARDEVTEDRKGRSGMREGALSEGCTWIFV